MESKIKEYTQTLDMYQQMTAQMALNRGGNPKLVRLLYLQLQALKKEITQNPPSQQSASQEYQQTPRTESSQ